MSRDAKLRGFTLIEMAVALFVIAIVLGSILFPLTTQVEQRQVRDAQRALEEIKEALIGFAVSRGYLPCPDLTSGANSNDGQEDLAGSNCASAEGNLPWATLGATDSDPFGNRFRYRVDTDFTNRASSFTLSSDANLEVCTTSTCSTTLPEYVLTTPGSTSPTNGAVAVILSHGRNALGAVVSSTGSTNTAPTGANELENTDGDNRFVSRVHAQAGAASGEFDDIVLWVGRHVLMNRMIAAGRLP